MNHWDYVERAGLNPAVRRKIERLEQDLERKCRSLWYFTNPEGNLYLMGRFCVNWDRLIVTVGCLYPGVGMITSK